jgi:hypothetical protein
MIRFQMLQYDIHDKITSHSVADVSLLEASQGVDPVVCS